MSNKNGQMSLVDAALDYVAGRLHVFPCKAGLKQPATIRGFYDATTDVNQIRSWWSKNPAFNIGIACGASRLAVIDIDGSTGEAGFAELESRFGKLPETTTVITPGRGGGRHLIYQGSDELFTMVGIAPGVDFKAAGGHIVAVPSTHPNGGEYQFEKGKSFTEKPPAKLPPLWIDYLQQLCTERADAAYHTKPLALSATVPLPTESRVISISVGTIGSVVIGR